MSLFECPGPHPIHKVTRVAIGVRYLVGGAVVCEACARLAGGEEEAERDSEGHLLTTPTDDCGQRWCYFCQCFMTPKETDAEYQERNA